MLFMELTMCTISLACFKEMFDQQSDIWVLLYATGIVSSLLTAYRIMQMRKKRNKIKEDQR